MQMIGVTSNFRLPLSAFEKWLPDMDSNHDKQFQRLLCYRYTIGQWSCGESKAFYHGVKHRPHSANYFDGSAS